MRVCACVRICVCKLGAKKMTVVAPCTRGRQYFIAKPSLYEWPSLCWSVSELVSESAVN